MLHTLNIDVETFSEQDLKKGGLHKYVEHRSFEVLLLSYSLDRGPVHLIDFTKDEQMPSWLLHALSDPMYIKKAWNAFFEIQTISKKLGYDLDPNQWQCTMIKAGMLGLPMGLADCAIALNTVRKENSGAALIRKFSVPCKPTKANGMRTRNLPKHFPEDWVNYGKYNIQDVYTEMDIDKYLDFYVIPAKEKRLYALDHKINNYGVLTDEVLVKNAIKYSLEFTSELIEEAKQLTGLHNPKSVSQLKEWLELEIDEEITTLRANAVPKLIEEAPNETVKRVLEIRQMISKSSVKKYDAMLAGMCEDKRQRGLLAFIGASRTWRWAGRRMQPQNIPANTLADLALLRRMLREGRFEEIGMLWHTPDALSQLIRTALIAGVGKVLHMSDFAAIEARVLAWYAGEEWKLEVFRTHGKIYEATASNMFGVPFEKVTKGSEYRKRGKVTELLCGYQGGKDAILRDPKNRSIGTDAELNALVKLWRDANPNIKQFWTDVNNAAIQAVKTGEKVRLRNLVFHMHHDTLFIRLPSGRNLSYLKPVVENRIFKVKKQTLQFPDGHTEEIPESTYTKDVLFYHGINQKTKQWEKTPTYGGKLVENIVQATSRDILAEKMLALDDAGFLIIFHVHDEVVIEGDEDNADWVRELIDKIMSEPLDWCADLPLKAETTTSPFYRKD